MKAFKLVDNIDLNNNNKEYNLAKIPIVSYNSNISKLLDFEKPLILIFLAKTTPTILVCLIQIKNIDIFDKLCIPYVGNKST